MCWIKTNDRMCITNASRECQEGMTWIEIDVSEWKLLDDGVPLYKITDSGRVVKRTDAEVKRDKKDQT